MNYFEDLTVGDKASFGSYAVTREEVLEFAQKYDPQPFHISDEAAAKTHFGRLAASGWHTGAMVMRMMCDAYLTKAASLGSPGLDKLQWLKPVYPGDELHVRLTVLEARPMNSKPHIGLVKSRWETFARRPNSDDEAVLLMEGWGMFRRRDVAPAHDGS